MRARIRVVTALAAGAVLVGGCTAGDSRPRSADEPSATASVAPQRRGVHEPGLGDQRLHATVRSPR